MDARTPSGRVDRPVYIASDRHTEAVGVKYQTCPHLAVHVPHGGSLAVRADELGIAIRCS
jgi:hypothetical protein